MSEIYIPAEPGLRLIQTMKIPDYVERCSERFKAGERDWGEAILAWRIAEVGSPPFEVAHPITLSRTYVDHSFFINGVIFPQRISGLAGAVEILGEHHRRCESLAEYFKAVMEIMRYDDAIKAMTKAPEMATQSWADHSKHLIENEVTDANA